MKTEEQIRRMAGAIKRGAQRGVVCPIRAVGRLLILAWVLDELPAAAEAFENEILDPTELGIDRVKEAMLAPGEQAKVEAAIERMVL